MTFKINAKTRFGDLMIYITKHDLRKYENSVVVKKYTSHTLRHTHTSHTNIRRNGTSTAHVNVFSPVVHRCANVPQKMKVKRLFLKLSSC